MAYGQQRENLPIEKIEKDMEFVLVKYQNKNEYTNPPKFYLVGNPDNVSVTFNDIVAVSHQRTDKSDTAMEAMTAKVIAMFNDLSDKILLTLLNETYEEFLETDILANYHGEKIICNITDPMNPKGSNTGGNNANDSDENGEQISSSPSSSNGNNGDNGNQNGNNRSGGNSSSKNGKRIQFIVNYPKDNSNNDESNQNSNNDGDGHFEDDKNRTDEYNQKAHELNENEDKEKEKFIHRGKFITFRTT